MARAARSQRQPRYTSRLQTADSSSSSSTTNGDAADGRSQHRFAFFCLPMSTHTRHTKKIDSSLVVFVSSSWPHTQQRKSIYFGCTFRDDDDFEEDVDDELVMSIDSFSSTIAGTCFFCGGWARTYSINGTVLQLLPRKLAINEEDDDDDEVRRSSINPSMEFVRIKGLRFHLCLALSGKFLRFNCVSNTTTTIPFPLDQTIRCALTGK
jgi:hypothetical protein